MNLLNNLNKIVYLLLFTTLTLSAQDSLSLIGTLQGKNIDEPIYNIFPVGDINGDGYSDFITVIPEAKYCNIYLGGDDFDLEPDIVIKSPTEGYSFNFYFTSGVGDVNNDGYDDFIIPGEYRSDRREFLFLGGETIDTIPTYQLKTDILGSSVSHGDVNGDGYSDFILGSPSMNRGGRAYLFLGGEPLRLNPSFYFIGIDSLQDFYGTCVDISGDINGDNYDDIIISESPSYLYPDSIFCTIYIYYGGMNVSSTPDFTFKLSRDTEITCVGDANKDGFDDFLTSNGLLANPKLYFGSENFSENNYLEFSAYKEINDFGVGFGGIGDINNDGYNDFAINIRSFLNNDKQLVGKLNIYLGSAVVDTIPDFALEGEVICANFGRGVGSLGDLNVDGYNEFYVLAPNYPDYEYLLGKVYIYSMKKFIVGVAKDERTLPKQFRLYQNYPNPFNPSTTISYALPYDSNVEITIYDITGKVVKIFSEQVQSSGYQNIVWNGDNQEGDRVSSGVYFYKLKATSLENGKRFEKTAKMLLLK